jgi:hypothetical protein
MQHCFSATCDLCCSGCMMQIRGPVRRRKFITLVVSLALVRRRRRIPLIGLFKHPVTGIRIRDLHRA